MTALTTAKAVVARPTGLREPNTVELRTILTTLVDGIEVFDDAGTLVSHNPAAAAMYEIDDGRPTRGSVTEKWEFLREDGSPLPLVDAPLARAMRTGVGEEDRLIGVRRRSDGGVRWLSVSTALSRDANRVTGYVSCTQDVTERLETMHGLRILTAAARAMSASLEIAEVITALTSAASALCSSPGERPRRAVLMVVAGDMLVLRGLVDPTASATCDSLHVPLADDPYAQGVVDTGEASVTCFTAEEFGPTSAGVIRGSGVRNAALVPMSYNGAVVAILAVSGRQETTITAGILTHLLSLATIGALAYTNATTHQRASDEARTDPLTALGNRRVLEERLAHLPRCPFAMLAIDVDHLKLVNDVHGHSAGDRLLVEASAVMAAELRPGDVLVRTGGDEFVALLANCDVNGAVRAGERLRAAVRTMTLPDGPASICVGEGAGLPGQDPHQVLAEADAALRREKAAR